MPLSRLVLLSGRSVDLAEIRMSSTYGGLLEGYPCERVNEFVIRSRLRVAGEAYPGRPVHLVPPVVEFPDRPAGSSGPYAELPAVACVGAFRSTEIDPDHDSGWYFSALTVVWFQPAADIPSGADAEPALRALAWEELARDLEE
ncbi:hypothetical protein [Streptomyces sp. B6B3]|uniref:hypothetical protein n=1 Tax=Streptomyces sp. B6B3 TaxID=3153570 RepID=UPI00325D423B